MFDHGGMGHPMPHITAHSPGMRCHAQCLDHHPVRLLPRDTPARHSGQVAFAGGKYEAQDTDLLATALREAHEEIGVKPHHVEILGELNHHYSVTRYKITPVVGYLDWPYPVQMEPNLVVEFYSR